MSPTQGGAYFVSEIASPELARYLKGLYQRHSVLQYTPTTVPQAMPQCVWWYT